MRTAGSTIPRILSLLAQFVTFCGFVVIVAGLARLQRTTNAVMHSNPPSEIVQAYDTTFNQALLTPYAGAAGFQFSFIWFIIFFELFILLLTLAITFLPRLLGVGRPAALALLASAFTLVVTVVNNLTYLHRNPTAISVYGKRDINVTFAGALLVVIGNGLTILALGFMATHHATGTHVATTTTPHNYGVAANQAKREVETGTV